MMTLTHTHVVENGNIDVLTTFCHYKSCHHDHVRYDRVFRGPQPSKVCIDILHTILKFGETLFSNYSHKSDIHDI